MFTILSDEEPHLSVLTLFNYFPQWIETRKRKKAGYENFSADPVQYRWQCWASLQGVGNSALDGIFYHPYPMDSDDFSSAAEKHTPKEVIKLLAQQCSLFFIKSNGTTVLSTLACLKPQLSSANDLQNLKK